MDITYPRTTLARLAGLASAIFTRTDYPAAVTLADREIDLAPMRRRELRSSEFAESHMLRAGVGPLGPYFGGLRR